MGTTTTNFSGTTQFSGGGSLTCSYAEPAVTYTTRPGQFNGKCDGTTQNAATLDVTFPSGTILSNSDTEVGDITTTGNVDIVANSESSSVLGVDAYAKFKYFAGPGTVGEQVGTVTIPFLVNATKLGIIPVKPMIPVICQ
jgi:hypothetical protein